MNPVPVIMVLAQLANMISSGVAASKQEQYQKDLEDTQKKEREKQEKLALRNAMSRALGVDITPYEKSTMDMPNKPSTAWLDTIGGASQAVSNLSAQDWANKMYSSKTPTTIKAQAAYPYEAL